MTDVPIRVLIADDHPLILAGMAALLETEPDMALVGQGRDGNEAVHLYMQLRPDLLLIDLNMPDCDGIAAITRIRAFDPAAKIVIMTSYEGDEDVHRGMAAGASAYLLKNAPFAELLACARTVLAGGTHVAPVMAAKLAGRVHGCELSAREQEILAHIATGKSNKVIARAAGIGVGTVKSHINSILSKLNVGSRTEAAVVAARRGLVHLV